MKLVEKTTVILDNCYHQKHSNNHIKAPIIETIIIRINIPESFKPPIIFLVTLV